MNVKMYTATTGEVRRYPTYPAGNKKGEYNITYYLPWYIKFYIYLYACVMCAFKIWKWFFYNWNSVYVSTIVWTWHTVESSFKTDQYNTISKHQLVFQWQSKKIWLIKSKMPYMYHELKKCSLVVVHPFYNSSLLKFDMNSKKANSRPLNPYL